MIVLVRVLKAFTHEGRALASGDIARMSPFAAAVLHHQGLVSLTRQYLAAELKPILSTDVDVEIVTETQPEKPKRRRRYRRRDLTAETA